MSYYRLMTSFFAYFSTGLAGLAAIFALMIWIIPSKRRFYGLATLQTVVDAALAYLLFFIMTNSLKQAERSTFNYEMNWTSQIFLVFIILPYVNLRISIGWILIDRIDPCNMASSSIRACYVIQFLVSGTIGLFIFIHCIILALWFTWKYLLFLGNLSLWPLQYLMNKEIAMSLGKDFMKMIQ